MLGRLISKFRSGRKFGNFSARALPEGGRGSSAQFGGAACIARSDAHDTDSNREFSVERATMTPAATTITACADLARAVHKGCFQGHFLLARVCTKRAS